MGHEVRPQCLVNHLNMCGDRRIGYRLKMPLPPHPVLRAYLFLNAGQFRRPWVVTRATLGSKYCQSRKDGLVEVLKLRVDCHPVVQFRIERNLIL